MWAYAFHWNSFISDISQTGGFARLCIFAFRSGSNCIDNTATNNSTNDKDNIIFSAKDIEIHDTSTMNDNTVQV